MKEWNEHIDTLIAASLAGEISDIQREELDRWTQLDKANEEYVESMRMIFSADVFSDAYDEKRTDRAWEAVKSRLSTGSGSVRKLNWIKYAAAAAVLLAAGLWMFRSKLDSVDETIVAAHTGVNKSSLPGGTLVSMKEGAEIRYLDDSTLSVQKVKLKGEAFFEVGSGDSGKLIVEVGELNIRDIGTAFNVRALPNADTVFVFVRDGIVALEVKNSEILTLNHGEEGFYIPGTGATGKMQSPDENAGSYADFNFRFRNTPLRKAVKKLNDVYNGKFAIANDQISDCRITVSFNGEPVDVIAEIMAQTLGLNVTENNGVYMFTGTACE